MNPSEIVYTICKKHDITHTELISRRQFKTLAAARRECARELFMFGMTKTQIGAAMNRDRTSVHHMLKA